jgi:response regulator RpfG family c-di-GMP phosphodiesterase
VADVFDAFFLSRPCRTELPLENVFEHIRKGRWRQFDPEVVDAFLGVVADTIARAMFHPVTRRVFLRSTPPNMQLK